MIRFANPGSDISSFIRIYIELFEALRDKKSFNLDDITTVLIERNLVTSCGYMGQEALTRSNREDRSRDPLYNQSKMYSELFKVLGWLHPSPDSALTFRFTFLGAHIVEVRQDPELLFKECVLGIVYPNSILKEKSDYLLRPFATILKSIDSLDGLICRDELIIGPLSLDNDRDAKKYSVMLEKIKSIRGNWRKLDSELQMVSTNSNITLTTMGNYTRFPLAVLKWTGWTVSERREDIYHRPIPFLIMTEEGRKVARQIEKSRDIRASDLSGLDENLKKSLVHLGFYQILNRAGFDLSPIADQLSNDEQVAREYLGNSSSPIIFSPFQDLEPEFVRKLFPDVTNNDGDRNTMMQPALGNPIARSIRNNSFSKVSFVRSQGQQKSIADREIVELFETSFQRTNDIKLMVELITRALAGSNKDRFYPLVAGLFRSLGYDCRNSRAGVNYERWDAFIIDEQNSIPIEIKSPGEEEFISVKAVRQALENKVILLARKAYPTRPETTSLVVGYNLPNDRSEVTALISDIHKAYGVVIGIIDIRSLLHLVAATLIEGKVHNSNELIALKGIIDVSNA